MCDTGSRTNRAFFDAYINAERSICRAFGISRGGVSEYISRLRALPSSARRDTALAALVRYRRIRNSLAHETGAMEHSREPRGTDVRWLSRFSSEVSRGVDVLSALSGGGGRAKFGRAMLLGGALAAAVAAVIYLLFALGRG